MACRKSLVSGGVGRKDIMWYNSRSSIETDINFKKGTRFHSLVHTSMPLPIVSKNELSMDRLFTNLADCTATIHTFSHSNENLLLEFSLDCLLAITDASAGSILIWDEVQKELVLRAARGRYLEHVSAARVKLREGVSGWVAHKGMSVLVKNINEDTRFQEVKRFDKYQSLSFISLPILSGNRLVGVINVTEKGNLSPFNEDDFDRVTVVAKHIAIAYENLKAGRKLQKENEDMHETLSGLQAQVKKQEPLVSIGKLAANLAHELNNPLDGIRRFVNLALDQMEDESLGREYLLKAKGGIRRAIRVIRGLLIFARQSHRQAPRMIEIHRVLDEIVNTARQHQVFSGIEFEYRFCGEPLQVRDTGLETVMQNLFENAAHAMNRNGKITIETRKAGQFVTVVVRDSGCGIPEHIAGRIFEPFFTTKDDEKGTGIGLAICRDIVERAGPSKWTVRKGPERRFTFIYRLMIRRTLPYDKINFDYRRRCAGARVPLRGFEPRRVPGVHGGRWTRRTRVSRKTNRGCGAGGFETAGLFGIGPFKDLRGELSFH